MPPITPVTRLLLIACLSVFVAQAIATQIWHVDVLRAWLGLYPLAGGAMPWQPATFSFLHADLTHLLFNLLGLWSFGPRLEMIWGGRRFLAFYAAGLAGSVLVYLLLTLVLPAPSFVGLSGALFAMMLAFAQRFPHQSLSLMLPPVTLSAKQYVLIFGGIEMLLGLTRPGDGLAHIANLGGLLGGWLMLRYWGGQPPFKRGGGSPGKRPNHLRRVH